VESLKMTLKDPSMKLTVGSDVMLTKSCSEFKNAGEGPLKPGETGTIAVPVAEGCVRRVKLAATIVSGSDMPKVGCARMTHLRCTDVHTRIHRLLTPFTHAHAHAVRLRRHLRRIRKHPMGLATIRDQSHQSLVPPPVGRIFHIRARGDQTWAGGERERADVLALRLGQ